MMLPFAPDGTGFTARLTASELSVVLDITVSVLTVLGGPPRTGQEPFQAFLTTADLDVERPEDPALLRLLPDGASDGDLASEFRRYTQEDLRAAKAERLSLLRNYLQQGAATDAVAADGIDPADQANPGEDGAAEHEIRVRAADGPAVAGALTDLRLFLASRLGIEDEDGADYVYDVVVGNVRDDEPDPGGARFVICAGFVILGELLASLLELMLDSLADGPGSDTIVER